MCAATAGLAMLIVCDFPEPVTCQTSTFSWPAPSSPDVTVSWPEVVVPPPEVLVWPPLVDVDSFSLSSCSKSSMSSFESSAKSSFSRPVVVEDDATVVELTVAAVVAGSEVVIWARPTPAAAAKASPTITPTRERRLNRLNRFCTFESLHFAGVWPYIPQSPAGAETCAPLLREGEPRPVRRAVPQGQH